MSPAAALLQAVADLNRELSELTFAAPTTHVYNPLIYAHKAHAAYLSRYANRRKKVLFLGMNPGPFGMAQTGVPFGEIAAVRDWMGIATPVDRPDNEHPKRPVTGFACPRSEVSGRRLWGLFAARYPDAKAFFRDHLVVNYCPLVFMEESGRNRTPDKLAKPEREAVFAACNRHLGSVISILRPAWLIGVGDFATRRAAESLRYATGPEIPAIGKILHPSPASPAANRGWAEQAASQLETFGVWPTDGS